MNNIIEPVLKPFLMRETISDVEQFFTSEAGEHLKLSFVFTNGKIFEVSAKVNDEGPYLGIALENPVIDKGVSHNGWAGYTNEIPPKTITNSSQLRGVGISDLIRFITDLRCCDCHHYVNSDWSCEDGNLRCQSCQDAKVEAERLHRQKEIGKLVKQLEECGVSVTIIDNESNPG
jgi:hypothetical protein